HSGIVLSSLDGAIGLSIHVGLLNPRHRNCWLSYSCFTFLVGEYRSCNIVFCLIHRQIVSVLDIDVGGHIIAVVCLVRWQVVVDISIRLSTVLGSIYGQKVFFILIELLTSLVIPVGST